MIIIAAAKNMSFSSQEHPKDILISKKTQKLIEEIAQLSKEEMGKIFKIKNKTLEKTYNYYQNFMNEKPMIAIQKYDGIVFKQLEREKIINNKEEYTYIESRVYIISALYGLINSTTLIKNYRLDFTNSKIIEGGLYNFWENEINETIKNKKHKSILNLASLEYSKIINQNIPIYNIVFTSKVNSTNLKKIRGQILNYCIKNKVINYADLVGMKTDFGKITSIEEKNLIFRVNSN